MVKENQVTVGNTIVAGNQICIVGISFFPLQIFFVYPQAPELQFPICPIVVICLCGLVKVLFLSLPALISVRQLGDQSKQAHLCDSQPCPLPVPS